MKKQMLFVLVLALAALLCACRQNPSEEELFSKLTAHFEERGYTCALARLDETDPERDVPIYKPSAWHRLVLNDTEEVLVYFDESNRADYLSEPVDESVYGHTARFGLRFVVLYPGEDAGIHRALEEMPQ